MNNKTALLLILDQEKINMGEKRKTGKIRTPWERDKPASMVGGKGQDPRANFLEVPYSTGSFSQICACNQYLRAQNNAKKYTLKTSSNKDFNCSKKVKR